MIAQLPTLENTSVYVKLIGGVSITRTGSAAVPPTFRTSIWNRIGSKPRIKLGKAVLVIVRSTNRGVAVAVIVGVEVAVDVDVAVMVAVAVAVAVLVGVGVTVDVAVLVAVAVAVAVFVGVDVCVGVGVTVGVDVFVAVAVAVAVFVGVDVCVGVGVTVGVDVFVAVAVAVAVWVLVGVIVGVLVFCGVWVAVGEMNVIEPFVVVVVSGELPVSASRTPDNVRADVPSETVENWTVVRIPSPFGPGCAPVVEQPNVTLLAPVVGGGQVTERPVEPRNASLVALIKASTPASQASVTS